MNLLEFAELNLVDWEEDTVRGRNRDLMGLFVGLSVVVVSEGLDRSRPRLLLELNRERDLLLFCLVRRVRELLLLAIFVR